MAVFALGGVLAFAATTGTVGTSPFVLSFESVATKTSTIGSVSADFDASSCTYTVKNSNGFLNSSSGYGVLTFTNETDVPLNVSFSATSSTTGSGTGSATIKVAGQTVTSFSGNLQPGETIVITAYVNRSGRSDSTQTSTSVVLSGFTVKEAQAIKYNMKCVAGASYTAVSGSETLASVGTSDVAVNFYDDDVDTTQFTLSCTPNSGYTMQGWMVGGKFTAGTGSLTCTVGKSSADIYPVVLPTSLASGTGIYDVGGNKFYTWETAMVAANGSGTVILLVDHTLSSTIADECVPESGGTYVKKDEDGNVIYTIPAGVKFLVPCDSNHTASFESEPTNINAYSMSQSIELFDDGGISARNYAYRVLTVSSGAKIDCYGSLNPNGTRCYEGQPYTGVSVGGYGKIILGSESTTFTAREEADIETQLIIRNGGTLYCYGYITGSGMVEVESGGHAHEFLQICDWPGGSNAFNWNTETTWTKNRTAFILGQYYIQNIEAPLKVNYGGICYLETACTVSGETISCSSEYINTKVNGVGMILLSEGAYLLRIYDQSSDRMNFHLKGGTVDFGSISMDFYYVITITIDSSDYILPLNGGMSFYVEDGATCNIAKRVCVLPGAEVYIKKGGTLNLSGQAYIWDVKDWTNSYFFNRAGMVTNTGYVMDNKSPNTAPVPYVATLDGISPRTTELVRGTDGSTTEYYYMDAINNPQGKFVVDGTLNISGSVSTTNGNSSAEKIVTGTGVINYTGTPSEGDMYVGYSDSLTDISTTYGLGNLAGVGTLQPFATGTYYGLGEDYGNYWYQWKVSATAAGDTTTGATVTGTSVPTIGAKSVGSNVLVGYIANSYTTNGSYTFAITPPTGYTLDSVTANNGTLSGSGPYTLTDVTADTTITLTLTQQATGATYSVTITWSQTSTATYTPGTTTYTWSPSELKYTANTTEAKWTGSSVMTVTIDNTDSDGAVTASFSYTKAIESTMSGDSLTVAAGDSDSRDLTVTPTGTPTTTDSEIILGIITITLSKEE